MGRQRLCFRLLQTLCDIPPNERKQLIIPILHYSHQLLYTITVFLHPSHTHCLDHRRHYRKQKTIGPDFQPLQFREPQPELNDLQLVRALNLSEIQVKLLNTFEKWNLLSQGTKVSGFRKRRIDFKISLINTILYFLQGC